MELMPRSESMDIMPIGRPPGDICGRAPGLAAAPNGTAGIDGGAAGPPPGPGPGVAWGKKDRSENLSNITRGAPRSRAPEEEKLK